MCGIVGFYSSNYHEVDDLYQIIWNMTESLEHRGPDDKGVWKDSELNMFMGHRRLSILDLTDAGHQPMYSRCKRYIIILNGEIYNHVELRKKLNKSSEWRGSSDTETIIECIAEWGVEKTLNDLEGMFSIALWDLTNKKLYLARDPFGEKPLYYGWQGNNFFFGSELKSLKVHPQFISNLDRNSLALYFRHNCIPSPYSIYEGINKLIPGSYLTLDFKDIGKAKSAKPTPFWQLNDAIRFSKENAFQGTAEEAIEEVEFQLNKSVKQQMLSDVPLGAFLSGGIDSSTIVALMQKNSMDPVKTFTIGFDNNDFDEAIYAKEVAKHLGTDHTELYLSPDDAMSVIPSLSSMYCEPFSDSSQIPTYLVSKLASESVVVSLSGDGGDEIFGGYNRYTEGQKVWSNFNKLPKSIRHTSGALLTSFSPRIWDRAFSTAKYLLPRKFRFTSPGDKAHKLAEVLYQDTQEEFYKTLCSHWKDPENIVLNSKEYPTLLTNETGWLGSNNFIENMMAMDTNTYLADDILVKVDRAAMACSLETRIPMLSKNVVQSAWSLPLDLKIRDGVGKWPLRQVLYKHVPKDLIERPKQGFGMPLGDWLRGPLHEWASDLLNKENLTNSGYINPEPVMKLWDEHSKGERNWQYQLWDVLMFETWLNK